MRLLDCIYIQQIKFAFDHRHILLIAVTEDYKQIMYLIDSHNQLIIGQAKFLYSSVFKYRDFEFFPYSIN